MRDQPMIDRYKRGLSSLSPTFHTVQLLVHCELDVMIIKSNDNNNKIRCNDNKN